MHSGYTRLIQLRERFSARRIGKESASTQEIAAKREPGNRNNNTGTNATAAHRHSAWCTLSGPGHKFQNRCVHRRRSVSIFRFSPSTSLLSFPSVLPPPLSFLPLCPSYPSTHLYITLRLLPTLHLISVLSVLPCPHSSALFHCLPHRFPSSVFRLLLLLFSLFTLPYSFLSTCSFLLSSPHHLPVVLSPLFFFFPLFSPPLPPLPAPALSARLLHPTSPPSPTFSNTPLRHTSPPSFLRHTFLLHSSSTPFPLFRFFSLGLQTSSLSPLFLLSSPPLFATLSSSLFHLHPSPHISPLLKDRIREEQNPLISRHRGFSSPYRFSSSPAITAQQHSPFKTNHLSTPDHRFTYQHLINTLSTYQQCIFISPVQPNVTALQGAVLADRS